MIQSSGSKKRDEVNDGDEIQNVDQMLYSERDMNFQDVQRTVVITRILGK